MPKRERVLVVQRIINTMGLHSIRDSLVDTVEKRGISGGQRKRVNLRSHGAAHRTISSDLGRSRLFLQALRREALLGVNMYVVLHQPSYAVFRMLVCFWQRVDLGPVDDWVSRCHIA